MKPRFLLITLLMLIAPQLRASDNSSRTFYLLADTPLSYLDFGLYKLDLALERQFRPDLARFLNVLPESIAVRTYLSAGKDTGMELIVETTAKAAADRARSQLQAENICELILGAQVRFMRANRLRHFFKSKDPFLDSFPKTLPDDLDKALILVTKVPTGDASPTVDCRQPLIAREK